MSEKLLCNYCDDMTCECFFIPNTVGGLHNDRRKAKKQMFEQNSIITVHNTVGFCFYMVVRDQFPRIFMMARESHINYMALWLIGGDDCTKIACCWFVFFDRFLL